MDTSRTCFICLMILSTIYPSATIKASNKLPCRSNKLAPRDRALDGDQTDGQKGRTFDYLFDFLGGDSSTSDMDNALPCFDNILSGESAGDGEIEQSSEEYGDGGDYLQKPHSPPLRPYKPYFHGDLFDLFGFNGMPSHKPPPPVHRPLPPGHYPMRPPLILPGRPTGPTGPTSEYPVRPTRPQRPQRPGGDGLSDIFGSVFGPTRPPFSSTIEEIKPVQENTGEAEPYMTWRPIGQVGVPSGMVIGLAQDFSRWTTQRPRGARRVTNQKKQQPQTSTGILGSFIDLFLKRR